jgi:hypothetical protein
MLDEGGVRLQVPRSTPAIERRADAMASFGRRNPHAGDERMPACIAEDVRVPAFHAFIGASSFFPLNPAAAAPGRCTGRAASTVESPREGPPMTTASPTTLMTADELFMMPKDGNRYELVRGCWFV